MNILTLSSLSDAPTWRKDNLTSPVDQWRIVRPYQNLKEMTDWSIENQRVFIPNFKKGMEITDQTYTDTLEYLKQYDLVVSSYFTNGSMFSLAMICAEKNGNAFVIDIDDDWFDLPDDNPVWTKITKNEWANMMVMIAEAPYMTTTNEYLAEKIRKHRTDKDPETVFVLPNMISTKEYEHKPIDNGEKIVIGWMGGASHYKDFHETGLLPALERIMHEHKNVELHICGMVIDHYLPKSRVKHFQPVKGLAWLDLFKDMSFDIGLAPLTGREFDNSKSDIKWQEYACMGAAFLGSNVGPYKRTVNHELDGCLTANGEEYWYKSLKKLVTDGVLRKSMATAAYERVKRDFSIENNWTRVKEVMEQIHENRRRNSNI